MKGKQAAADFIMFFSSGPSIEREYFKMLNSFKIICLTNTISKPSS